MTHGVKYTRIHTIDRKKKSKIQKQGKALLMGELLAQATDDYYLTGFNFPFHSTHTHSYGAHSFK